MPDPDNHSAAQPYYLYKRLKKKISIKLHLQKKFPDPDPLHVQKPDPDYESATLPKALQRWDEKKLIIIRPTSKSFPVSL